MFDERFAKKLSLKRKQGLYRNPPRVEARSGKYLRIGGRKVLNFSANDYLGLGTSKHAAARVAEHFHTSGGSSSSSRLVCGNYEGINRAEEIYAAYFGYETALFLPSGFQANVAVISTLFEKGDTVFYDKHIHASAVTGLKLSAADGLGYNHSDFSHLAKRLSVERNSRAVLTESLFSMDGDLLDVVELEKLKREHGFLAVVDEAHAFGAIGDGGRGIAQGVADVAVGTFGKAFGFFGAFVLLSQTMKDYLFNFAPALIYSTTLPEAHAASAIELLQLVEQSGSARQTLREISGLMREELRSNGFQVRGDAHIIVVEIGDEESATGISGQLLEKGFFVFSARYPTVPLGKAILRISMSALHDEEDVSAFVEALNEACRGKPS